jgi:hypothetical protein
MTKKAKKLGHADTSDDRTGRPSFQETLSRIFSSGEYRHLDPELVVQIMNSYSDCEPVLSLDKLHEHRLAAGGQISEDFKTVNILAYIAWVCRKRHLKIARNRVGISVEHANKIAMDLVEKERQKFLELSERKQATRIGCSWQTWQRTLLYQILKLKRPARKPSSPKTVSLTATLEAVTGEDDRELQRLIDEQEADKEPSPLEPDPPDRTRATHFGKRL